MNEKKQFYSLIKPVQKLLFIEFLLRNLQNFLFFSALACCFWLLISRFIVFPYLFAAISYTIVLLVIFFGWFVWKKHPTERDAVNRFNQFVPDDRVISAYYFIEKDGEVETLLVQNAIQHMKESIQLVRSEKKRWLNGKMTSAAIISFLIGIGSLYLPNETMKKGFEKAKEKELIEEFTKEIKKEAKKDPAKKETMEQVLEEAKNANTPEELMENIAKSLKEIELKQLKEQEKQRSLEEWKEKLKNAQLTKLHEAIEEKDEKKLKEALKELEAKTNQLSKEQQTVLKQFTNSDSLAFDQLEKQIQQALLAEKNIQHLEEIKQTLLAKGTELAQKIEENGLEKPNVALLPKQNGQKSNPNSERNNGTSSHNHSSSNHQSNSNQHNNQSPGNNSNHRQNNNGNTNGAGNGNSTGLGQGNAIGEGNGSIGAGFGTDSRLLTIPETIEGKENLYKDFGTIGEGKLGDQYESNTPVLKGTLRPYEEVLGIYERSYRESVDRMRLPKDLELYVKNYFSHLKR